MIQVSPESPPRSWGWRLVRALMMPAHWIERARGANRAALLLLYALIALVIGLFAWREAQLFAIPDIGDPFDAKPLLERRVADEDNAFVLYREAAAKLRPMVGGLPASSPRANGQVLWDWVDANPEALAIWKRGTERPDAIDIAPDVPETDSSSATAQHLYEFARMAVLESRRLRDQGDLNGALELDLAILRSSRHAAAGGTLTGRILAAPIHGLACRNLEAWAADPKVDAALLRRALEGTRKSGRLPGSSAFREEYLRALDAMSAFDIQAERGLIWPQEHPFQSYPTVKALYFWMLHEPERGRRVYRLWMANMLAYCDLPRGDRPPLAGARFLSYEPGEGANAVVHRLSPEDLEKQIEASPLARAFIPQVGQTIGAFDFEAVRHDNTVLTLAERLYTLEQGHPPKVLGELLGRYLEALPEGNGPGDPPLTATPPTDEAEPR